MSSSDQLLGELVGLSNQLGDPANDYVILGEGNTSVDLGDGTFYVKGSGSHLRTAGAESFVRIDAAKVMELVKRSSLTDEEVRDGLNACRTDSDAVRHPSVETVMHAMYLQLDGVNFVGHTHPTPINAITCAERFHAVVQGRIFPDEIVLCGVAPMVIPYVDPGIPLARETMRRINAYLATYKEVPRLVLMQNHGMIALGSTAQDVLNITQMAVKAARILVGTFSLGGPRFLSPKDVARIHTRPDEAYRKRIILDIRDPDHRND